VPVRAAVAAQVLAPPLLLAGGALPVGPHLANVAGILPDVGVKPHGEERHDQEPVADQADHHADEKQPEVAIPSQEAQIAATDWYGRPLWGLVAR
jgi:hypothetical protein